MIATPLSKVKLVAGKTYIFSADDQVLFSTKGYDSMSKASYEAFRFRNMLRSKYKSYTTVTVDENFINSFKYKLMMLGQK